MKVFLNVLGVALFMAILTLVNPSSSLETQPFGVSKKEAVVLLKTAHGLDEGAKCFLDGIGENGYTTLDGIGEVGYTTLDGIGESGLLH